MLEFKSIAMKRLLPIILLSILMLGGCASKRYAKKGLKYEQAGMYEMAAEMYYQAIKANTGNVDAAIGLKKNGQRVLDEKGYAVGKAYLSGDDKGTVYSYLDAKAYFDKICATGVPITISSIAQGYFDETKPRYLSKIYDDARLLLEDEKFKESETLFAEIKRIDPDYQGIDEHMKVSQCEPLYRKGHESLTSGLYRLAYANFNQIITTHGNYKDSKDLRDEALSKGMVTISIATIENRGNYKEAGQLIESKIIREISALNNPFIKVVDSKNTQQFITHQQQGVSAGSPIQVGQIFSAKTIFNGTIIKFDTKDGNLTKVEKRGYLKEEVTTKAKETGEEKKETRYHKVTYFEFQKENKSEVSFQFKLSSIETGIILISDALNLNASDAIHYATFEGDKNKLVPGYWEFSNKTSPKDKIEDNPTAVKTLKNLLSAQQNIKTISSLQEELTESIAKKVAGKINQYNPENQ